MSDQGAQIKNPEGTTDRGPKRQRTASGAARTALVQPRKRSFGRVSAAVLVRPRQRFGPGFVPLASILLRPINTPGVLQNDISIELG